MLLVSFTTIMQRAVNNQDTVLAWTSITPIALHLLITLPQARDVTNIRVVVMNIAGRITPFIISYYQCGMKSFHHSIAPSHRLAQGFQPNRSVGAGCCVI